ncbi:Arm DNA-binding domain-containing protein [Dysgonomonas sp. HGC4]|nr:Arm DNA-binding domain-containing protein [Dysgonomonas sp. HGC4]MBD8347852.1 hypothetical protein [Dysgonomonas sp. HGC4]
MRSTFSILFFIKKNEPKKNRLCTIMTRITIEGTYLQFSTKTDIFPEQWITNQGRAKGSTTYAKEINRQLDHIRSQQIKRKIQICYPADAEKSLSGSRRRNQTKLSVYRAG